MELGVCRPRRGHGDAPSVCPCLCPQLLAVQPQRHVSVSARLLSEGPASVRLLLRVQREGWQRVQRDARAVRIALDSISSTGGGVGTDGNCGGGNGVVMVIICWWS